ncbi:dethiobiotin synthase [Nitrincola tapanii]|uniref:ATP-dependent dethiobiotin synthetase BioD n=1 Tax=Nitrincola tapanii TaxID=1708751 RepID=A0A5A9W188_9GAMM|nr:dethiobiotin synthase [Nitrincola tapanii]KAA0873878.1 dethiobiotin synthase [Nitrincola tapanii]
MKAAWFVCGTDTGVGKTLVTGALMHAAIAQGYSTVGLKPLAAGCELTAEGWRNEDALHLQACANVELSYDQINPVALPEAVAPHLAAGTRILSAERIAAYCRGTLMQPVDQVFIEGAGGWRVPLNAREAFSEVPRLLNLPIIMVVGMRLGCLNHALLTAEAIARDGLRLAGWVANQLDPEMPRFEENLESLIQRLRAPLLGVVPWMSAADSQHAAQHLDLSLLLSSNAR